MTELLLLMQFPIRLLLGKFLMQDWQAHHAKHAAHKRAHRPLLDLGLAPQQAQLPSAQESYSGYFIMAVGVVWLLLARGALHSLLLTSSARVLWTSAKRHVFADLHATELAKAAEKGPVL